MTGVDLPYPAAPVDVPRDLTAPTREHNRQLLLGLLGLVLFVGAYLGLLYELVSIGLHAVHRLHGEGFLVGAFVAGVAFFLAAFLVSGIFAVKRTADPRRMEIKREDEPVLFAFIDRVAEDAAAPKPHRVFVTPDVNAAVFYDLSFRNLLLPTKKNLLIGLGLANTLSLDEMKAVLGHEFGHFAQRSMRVGTYVYVSWQVVQHLVGTRGGFDTFVRALSRIDLRVAWIGWGLSIILWSIRAVLDTLFRGLVVLERALSREMEFQADLVAVTISGSDSLVHALSRLGVADEAWDVAASFTFAEAQRGRPPADLYDVQTRVLEHFRVVRRKPGLGLRPAVGPGDAARVFPVEMVLPPRMWSTHPPNRDREENVKRRYVASTLDERPAWILFRDPAATRASMTRHLLKTILVKDVSDAAPAEDTQAKLAEMFGRRRHLSRYHGLYQDRSVVRTAVDRATLVVDAPTTAEAARARLAALYPDSLATDLDRWREIEREHVLLSALKRGLLEAPGGVIRFRGEDIGRRELDRVVGTLEEEVRATRRRLAEHDREIRSAHRGAAALVGNGWPEHLDGLLDVLFYAEHQSAALAEAAGHLKHVIRIATADGRVSGSEMALLIRRGDVAHDRLMEVYDRAGELVLAPEILAELGAESWAAALGVPKIPSPTRELLAKGWVEAFFSWVTAAQSHLELLRYETLDALLAAEDHVAACVRDGTDPGAAPAPCRAPRDPVTILEGESGKWKEELGAWEKFQLAHGWGPGAARLAIASSILGGGILFASGSVGKATVVVQNGLATSVRVDIAGTHLELPPLAHRTMDVPVGVVHVETQLADGSPLESFEQDLSDAGWETQIYNVASASVLRVEETAYGTSVGGPPTTVGAPRWYVANEDDVLEPPPQTTEIHGGGAIRHGLQNIQMTLYQNALWDLSADDAAKVAAVHLRYDSADTTSYPLWAAFAPAEVTLAIVRERRQKAPDDVELARVEMDATSDEAKASLCDSYDAAAAAEPSSADRAYVAIRCRADSLEQDDAFLSAYRAHPDNLRLGWSAGWAFANRAQWSDAWPLLDGARNKIPSARLTAPDMLRVARMATHGSLDPQAAHEILGDAEVYELFLRAERDPASLEPTLAQIGSPFLHGALLVAMGRIADAGAVEGQSVEEQGAIAWRVALSPAATREQIDAAFALPPTDLGWPWLEGAIALATVEGRPIPDEWRAAIVAHGVDRMPPGFDQLLVDPASVDASLATVHPRIRGTARWVGLVLLRDRAPQAWRDEARLLLLPHERPRLE